MTPLDRVVLAIKRRETPAAARAHDAARRLRELEVPDGVIVKLLFGNAHRAFEALAAAGDWAASTLVYAPLLRARCAHAGRGLRVRAAPYIRGHAYIRIGDHCTFESFEVATGRFVDAPVLTIGSGCAVGPFVQFTVNKRVTIGDGVFIDARASIQDSDGHPSDRARRSLGGELDEQDVEPVTIREQAYIGAGAHVLKGVTVGRGAVVAAGAVVVSDVPDFAVVAGVPSRAIHA